MDEPRQDPGWEPERRRVARDPVHHRCPSRQRCNRSRSRQDLLGRQRRDPGRKFERKRFARQRLRRRECPVLPGPAAPAGTGAPVLSGGPSFGSTLSCSQASWAPDLLGSSLYRAPQSIAYSWTLNGASISGVNSSTITANSAGQYVCRVTASNVAGSTSQGSAGHAVLPVLPAISGKPTLRAKIKSGAHTASFRFRAGGATGFQCVLIKRRKHAKKQMPHFASCRSPKRYCTSNLAGTSSRCAP